MKPLILFTSLLLGAFLSAAQTPSTQVKIICSSSDHKTQLEIKKERVFTSADESVEKIVNVIVIRHQGKQQKYVQGEMYSFTTPHKNSTFIREDLDNVNLFGIKFNSSKTRAAITGKDQNWGLYIKPVVLMSCRQLPDESLISF